MFRIMTGLASLVSTETPWWMGVPTTLIKKTTLVEEAQDRLPVHTLTFAIPQNVKFSGRAKSHADVDLSVGDVVKMVIPGYKPKSYSMSALRENEFDVTFKVYPNGRASGFLNRLQVGQEMGTFGLSSGRYRNPGTFVGIVAYGVGITEGLPVAIAELEEGTADKVVLVWACRTMADVFWQDQLQDLMTRYPHKFQLIHVLSREQQQHHPNALYGRVTPQLLDRIFQPKDRHSARFLSVGTKEMMRETDAMLQQINYPMPQHALLVSKA